MTACQRNTKRISGCSSKCLVRLSAFTDGPSHCPFSCRTPSDVETGQGPYFGQWAWFLRFHSEKLPSAVTRYATETERIISVLDGVLTDSAAGWLVGNHCTYADLSFVTWAHVADGMFKQSGTADVLGRYPSYNKWLKAMGERASVKEVIEAISKGRVEHGLPP